MATRQQVPITKKVTFPPGIVGFMPATEPDGLRSIVFISQLGEAHVFELTPDDEQLIIKELTGGIEVPRAGITLPPGVAG